MTRNLPRNVQPARDSHVNSGQRLWTVGGSIPPPSRPDLQLTLAFKSRSAAPAVAKEFNRELTRRFSVVPPFGGIGSSILPSPPETLHIRASGEMANTRQVFVDPRPLLVLFF